MRPRALLRPDPLLGALAVAPAVAAHLVVVRWFPRLGVMSRLVLAGWAAMSAFSASGISVAVAGRWTLAGGRVLRTADIVAVRYRSIPRVVPQESSAVFELRGGSTVALHGDPFAAARLLGVPCVASR